MKKFFIRLIFFALLFFGAALIFKWFGLGVTETKQQVNNEADQTNNFPPDVIIPEDAIRFGRGSGLCEYKESSDIGLNIAAYTLSDVKNDEEGCHQPTKSWMYDSNRSKWEEVNSKNVRCCNPPGV